MIFLDCSAIIDIVILKTIERVDLQVHSFIFRDSQENQKTKLSVGFGK